MDVFVNSLKVIFEAQWLERIFESVGLDIPAEKYAGLFPNQVDKAQIAVLINERVFPTFKSLAPIFVYCAAFSLFRYILQCSSIFINFASSSMDIRMEPESNFAGIEKINPFKKTLLSFKKPSLRKADADIQDAKRKHEVLVGNYNKEVSDFCKSNNLDLALVRSYLKLRGRNASVEKKIIKFVEAFWRGLFYTMFVVIGYQTLFNCDPSVNDPNEPTCNESGIAVWVSDMKLNWDGYPYHKVSNAVKFYYHMELGCYLHQLLWCEVTTSRTDSLEMIVHHIATIALLSCSYLTNHVRIGSVILIVHDVADIFLEFAKCFNYVAQNNKKWKDTARLICDSMFGVFVIVFFASRLVIYPGYVLRSYFFDGFIGEGKYGFDWVGGKIFTVCLLLLQILHVYWFSLILIMIKKLLTTGIETDCRSDDEVNTEGQESNSNSNDKKTK